MISFAEASSPGSNQSPEDFYGVSSEQSSPLMSDSVKEISQEPGSSSWSSSSPSKGAHLQYNYLVTFISYLCFYFASCWCHLLNRTSVQSLYSRLLSLFHQWFGLPFSKLLEQTSVAPRIRNNFCHNKSNLHKSSFVFHRVLVRQPLNFMEQISITSKETHSLWILSKRSFLNSPCSVLQDVMFLLTNLNHFQRNVIPSEHWRFLSLFHSVLVC